MKNSAAAAAFQPDELALHVENLFLEAGIEEPLAMQFLDIVAESRDRDPEVFARAVGALRRLEPGNSRGENAGCVATLMAEIAGMPPVLQQRIAPAA